MNHNLLRVSSDFRQPGFSTSTSNFVCNYNNVQSMMGIVRCVMKSCDICNCFYNIDNIGYNFENTGNNVLTVTDFNGDDTTFTFPRGQYSINQLLSAINTNMITLGYTPSNGITFQLNQISNKIEIINTTGSQSFGLLSDSTMAPYIGFNSDVVYAYTPTSTADVIPNLAGLQEVYITSQRMSDSSNMVVAASTVYPVILNVQINVPFGTWIHYTTNHPEIDDIEYPSISQGNNLQQIDIQIRDRFGNIVDLQNQPFNLIVKVYHGHN